MKEKNLSELPEKLVTKATDGRKTAAYLFLAVLSATVLPNLLSSIAMLASGYFLSGAAVAAFHVLGVLLSICFALLAALTLNSGDGEKRLHKCLRFFVDGGKLACLWVVVYVFTQILSRRMNASFAKTYHLILFLMILALVLGAVLGTWLFFALVAGQRAENRYRGSMSRLGMLARRPLHYLLWMVLLALFVVSPDAIRYLMGILPLNLPLSVVSGLTLRLLCALVQAGVLYLMVYTMQRCLPKWEQKDRERVTRKRKKLRPRADVEGLGVTRTDLLAGVISGGCLLVAAVVGGILSRPGDLPDLIVGDIAADLSTGSYELLAGEYENALYYYRRADSHINGWKAYIQGNGSTLKELAKTAPQDAQLQYLALSLSLDPQELEEYLRKEQESSLLKMTLLSVYHELEAGQPQEMTPERVSYQKELLLECAANGQFTQTIYTADRLEGKSAALEKQLNEYAMVPVYCSALELVTQAGREGKLTTDLVRQLLALAEDNLKDVNVQYIAGVYGASLLYDDANHYEATAECLKRFADLYEQNKENSKEDILTAKMKAAKLMMHCFAYEDALEILTTISDQEYQEEIQSAMMLCYEELERYEECAEIAGNMLAQNENDPSAVFYAYLSALKLGETEEAFDRLFDMSRIVTLEELDSETRMKSESLLFAMLEYVVVDEVSSWTDFHYAYYEELTEAQLGKLKGDPFLEAYLDAVYNCYDAMDYEAAEKSIDQVLAVSEDFAQAWYLKGAILFGAEEFEKAAAAYQQAIALNSESPTYWYALANAYDALEMYEEAYDASLKVTTLMPDSDHDLDWYGVGYHNNRLLNQLKSKVGGE